MNLLDDFLGFLVFALCAITLLAPIGLLLYLLVNGPAAFS